VRILFDKNVALPLRRFLVGHSVGRSDRLAWGELKNGALLNAAEEAGFDVIVTADQNIAYQQNIKERKIALVVLGAGNWPIIRNHTAEIAAAVDAAKPNSFTFIEMPLPPKRPYVRLDE
jgi:hypothetical protein